MRKTVYEWVWELCDEFDDVLDVEHTDKLETGPQHEIRMGYGLPGYDLALQKNVYDVLDDNLEVKAYAYVDPLTKDLEDEYDLEAVGKPPKRFQAELDKWFSKKEAKQI